MYGTFTLSGLTSQTVLLSYCSHVAVRTPERTRSGLGSFHFARRYFGNRVFFLFLALLRCFSSGGSLDIPIFKFSITYLSMNPGEFPHSEISGSMLICSSPKLIAAYHVFHRLPVPRHSPCALVRLTFQTFFWNIWYPLDSLLPTKIIVTLPFEIVIFLKKELTIIFVSQLLFSFQGTSLSVLFRALKIEQYLLCLYLSPVPDGRPSSMFFHLPDSLERR